MSVCVQWSIPELGISQSVGMATLRSTQQQKATQEDESFHDSEEVIYCGIMTPLYSVEYTNAYTVNVFVNFVMQKLLENIHIVFQVPEIDTLQTRKCTKTL